MLTADHIKKALSAVGAVGGQMKPLGELATGATEALRQAPSGLTVAGAAAFLATMAQESAWFRTTEEYAKNGRYAPYIGRTFEQITWKDNYRAFGAWCKAKGLLTDADQFVKDPKSLADYRWAWLGGVWYFEANGLWSYANRGDFLAVQRGVNLGNPQSSHTPAGYPIRKKAFDAFLSVGSDLLPDEKEPPVVDPKPENVGVWAVDPGKVSSVLLGRQGTAIGNELSPGTTIADGVEFVQNNVGRYALLRSSGWSYDREYLVQIGAGPVPVKRQFPVIPDYDTTERIEFRGGLVCRCLAISLPWIEFAMLEAGVIKWNLDIYQLGYRKDVAASALTHAGGGVVDLGQYTDPALRIAREFGLELQRRVPPAFSYHGHGVLKGCDHISLGNYGAEWQVAEWERGRNGLGVRGPITGPEPKGNATPKFDAALSAYLKKIGAPPVKTT